MLLVVGATALAGCTDEPEEQTPITVTGEPGAAPALVYTAPLLVEEESTEVLWEGAGPELVDGEAVLIDYAAENTLDRTVRSETYTSRPSPRRLTPEDLGVPLYQALRGLTVGSRILHLSPPGPDGVPLAVVVDVLPTRAEGEPVLPRPGLPTVTLDGRGAPSIGTTDGPPPDDLVVQPLIRGGGAQVRPGQVVTVQYTAVTWGSGEPYASTWDAETPMVQTEIGRDPQDHGWDAGLVEQTVGSQVMLVVPPSFGLGDEALVFVVDVLAADGHPEDDEESS